MCSSKYLFDMKKILLLICAVALWSCDKNEIPVTEEPEQEQEQEQEIDLTKVNVKIELSCIEEKTEDWGDVKHTILCTGSIGGFVGLAEISLTAVYSWPNSTGGTTSRSIWHNNTIMVVGDCTTFSYIFDASMVPEATGRPLVFDVRINTDNKTVYDSDLVMIL